MILFILPLIALAANNLIGGIDYLFKLLFPSVPPTAPLSKSYTPPFTGGQCEVPYILTYSISKGNNTFENGSVIVQGKSLLGYTLDTQQSPNPLYGNWQFYLNFTNGTFGERTGAFIWSEGASVVQFSVVRQDGLSDNCGNLPNPNPTLPIGGNGLPSSPPPVLYTPPNTTNNNFFPLIAGLAAVAATALTAATAAAAATAATAVTAATAASTAATAAIASAPSGSTIQQQSQSQKFSADALVGIAQVLAEVARQIAELEKEVRKLKTGEAKKEKDDAKKVIRYDFGSANRDGFIKLYPESNPDGFEATFVDVQIFNIPSGSGKYFGEKSPHYYKYKSLGQVHFVSPTFGILESREIDFARLSLNVPDNCFGFFYHFGLDGIVSANLSGFYAKTEKQAV